MNNEQIGDVQLDVSGLRTLLERVRAIGTLDKWAELALEWAGKAEAEVTRLRPRPIDVEVPPAPRLFQCWEEPVEDGLTKTYMLVMLRDSERALLVDAIATEVIKRLHASSP